MNTDLKNLKIKADAGADWLITQLFYENADFYSFREKCELLGISAPIIAGIMPITNKRQVMKISQISGARIPGKFQKILQRYEDNPPALADAGIAYAIDQIVDLITTGVAGVHLYTMNKTRAARKIHEAVRGLLDS